MTSPARPDRALSLAVLRFRPALAYVDGIRELGRAFCARTFTDAELAERARMVLQELLENAVKYSAEGGGGEVEVALRAEGGAFTITCSSHPQPDHLATLRAELAQLRLFDAEAAYLVALQRAAREPQAPARLGLARMRFEGRFELELEEIAGDRIRVRAVTRV